MEEETAQKLTFRGELALLVAVAINSFGVVLMLHSGAGISAISSVPFAFSQVLPHLTLGHLDLYLSGTAGAEPYDPAEAVCTAVSF